jgi:hypothetical protein
MQTPMTVTFRGMNPSAWIEGEVRKRAAKLEALCGDLTSCHVVVDVPHRHHAEGNRFSVRIDMSVPGDELAVTHDANVHASKKDIGEEHWTKQFDVEGERKHLRLVIKDAFDVARRRLQVYVERRRLDVKTHQEA